MTDSKHLDPKEILEQFTEGMKAVAELTRALQSLQSEVEDHSEHILGSKAELLILKEKMSTIVTLVQGDGLQNSLQTSVVRLETKMQAIEEQIRDARKGETEAKKNWIAVVAIIVSVLTALGSVLGPLMIKVIQAAP